MANTVQNKASLVTHEEYRFLIVDCPTDANLPAYLEEMKRHKVACLVRATECSYSKETCLAAGVPVEDMAFADGEPPPEAIITRWLTLCATTFKKKDGSAISVHCVAGLGRAPVLVALALIERGMEPLDAVQLIRDKRRGAINAKQLRYLEYEYKKRTKPGSCVIA